MDFCWSYYSVRKVYYRQNNEQQIPENIFTIRIYLFLRWILVKFTGYLLEIFCEEKELIFTFLLHFYAD